MLTLLSITPLSSSMQISAARNSTNRAETLSNMCWTSTVCCVILRHPISLSCLSRLSHNDAEDCDRRDCHLFHLGRYVCRLITLSLSIRYVAVCGCLSCIIVYFRRSSRMAIAQQHQGYTYNGGDEKPIQMVATQPTHSMAPTPPMLSSQGHLNGSGVHMHTQSAIPWATPVSPSVQSSGAPRF